MPPPPLFDYRPFNYDRPQYSLDEVRKINPQRHEMEQLSGVVWVDPQSHGIIGFKDVTDDEFWIKGHMPGYPLMPGVILCEAAAQLVSFYAKKFSILGNADYLGFGGMDGVRFRTPVYPNCRLIICAKGIRIKPKMRAEFEFQGYVEDTLVYHGNLVGVPISRQRRMDSH